MMGHSVTFAPSTTGAFGDEVCKCCHGSGIQYNLLTGMNVRCPCCNGSGKWNPPLVDPIITCEDKGQST